MSIPDSMSVGDQCLHVKFAAGSVSNIRIQARVGDALTPISTADEHPDHRSVLIKDAAGVRMSAKKGMALVYLKMRDPAPMPPPRDLASSSTPTPFLFLAARIHEPMRDLRAVPRVHGFAESQVQRRQAAEGKSGRSKASSLTRGRGTRRVENAEAVPPTRREKL